MIRLAVAVAVCALLTASSYAQRAPDAPAQAKAAPNAAGYPALPLLSTSTTVVGEKLRYPDGEPHVTAAIVTLLPGQRTIPHTHGVPLFAYILDGELSVDYGAHGIRTYKKGDSLMEAMDVVHFGFNPGKEPVRLLAVYMGAKGAKDVVPVK